MSFCGLLLGGLSRHLHRKRVEAVAASEIRRMGGKVTYSPVFDEKLWLTDSSQPATWQHWLFSQFRSVTGVRLVGDRVTDDKLAKLSGLANLRRLSLGKTGITNRGLVRLCRLDRLAHLDLQDTAIGDAALCHVSQLRRLQSLNLRCTAVSDAGLEYLAALKTLELLVLEGTHVTPQGIEKLHRSLPNARIHTGSDSTTNRVASLSGLVASRRWELPPS